MKRLLKIITTIIGLLVVLLIVVLLFISPIAEYVIEKNSEQYTGRRIQMEKLWINLLSGRITIDKLLVPEANQRDTFLFVHYLEVDLDVRKLMASTYRIEKVIVDKPFVHVIQKGERFNFSDILDKFAGEEKEEKKPEKEEPTRYFLENIQLKEGRIEFESPDYQLDATILETTITSPGIAWNNPQLSVDYRFRLLSGGQFSGSLGLNLDDLAYLIDLHIKDFDLAVLNPYMKPYSRSAGFTGKLTVDALSRGNFNEPAAVAVKGKIQVQECCLNDAAGKPVAKFTLFEIPVDSLNMEQDIWRFGNILLKEPYLYFSLTPEGDNFSSLFILEPASASATDSTGNLSAEASYDNPFIIIANYVESLAKELVITNYRISSLTLQDGQVEFSDQTLDEPFTTSLKKMQFALHQLNSANQRATAEFKTDVDPWGKIIAGISINPNDFMDFEINYDITNVYIPYFNQYTIYHISHPFRNGNFNYGGHCRVTRESLKMENNLWIRQAYAGKRVKNETGIKLPIRLALALLRNRDGDIKLTIPIEGTPSDPEFKIWRIVGQVLKNLVIKAATAPFDLLASAFGGGEADFKEIRFEYGQDKLTEKQIHQLKTIGNMLLEKSELIAELEDATDSQKEMEFLALRKIKTRYHFEAMMNKPALDSLNATDLAAIEKINEKDTAFLAYIDQLAGPNLANETYLEKCILIAGRENLEAQQQQLMQRRQEDIFNFLVNTFKLPEGRLKFTPVQHPAEPPSTPTFKLTYHVYDDETGN